MSLVTSHVSISLDGFVAGPDQTEDDPIGRGGMALHTWHIPPGPEHEADRTASARILEGNGAYVMGRNMFGPIRGGWDRPWDGWWGDEPPYHAPVFVLTHHAREPLEMQGGTTFHFVTDGFDAALARARAAAGDADVSIAGGAGAVRQALAAGALDELTLDIVPILLGSGERLLQDLDGVAFEPLEVLPSPLATHIRYRVLRAS